MRKVLVIILTAISLLTLTSCYDAAEKDSELYVLVIGIDMGISDKWRLTLQFSTMQEGKGGGGGGRQSTQEGEGGKDGGEGEGSQGSHTFISIDAPSFFSAIDMLNTTLTRKLNFEHAQIIVLSEEISKSGLMGEFFAPINRFRQIRRSAKVFVVRGKATDFIKENKPFIGTTIAKSLQTFVLTSEFTGFSPNITAGEFYEGLKGPRHQPIVPLVAVNDGQNFIKEGEPWGDRFRAEGDYTAGLLPRIGANKIESFGLALFDGDKMVGDLTGGETRLLLMIRNEFKGGNFTIVDPKAPNLIVPINVQTPRRTKVSIDTKGEKPIIKLKVRLDGELLASQAMINYEVGEMKKELEGTFANFIKDGIEKVIKKCQKLGVDPFSFGAIAQKKFLTIDKFEEYHWDHKFKEAKVEVEVDFKIRRTGTLIKSFPIKPQQEENR